MSGFQRSTLLLLLFTSSCATSPGYIGPDELPTRQTASRHQYHGFSVQPPRDRGWTVRVSEQDYHYAIFRLRTSSPTHSVYCSADLSSMPIAPATVEEFAEQTRPTPPADPERFSLLAYSQELTTRQGQTCVAFRELVLDRNAPNSPNADLHMRNIGWICRHPASERSVLRVVFSERALPEELEPGFEAEAPKCLEAFTIESLEGVPAA